MEQFDDVIFRSLVSFLTTREYIMLLRLSKFIRQKSLKYKKLRQPCIFVLDWCDFRECYYELNSKDHYIETVQNMYPDIFLVNNLSKNQDLIRMILTYGKHCRGNKHDILLLPVPWMFRHAVNIKKRKVSIKKYLKKKMDKYIFKNHNDSVFLDKLRQKYNLVTYYNDVFDKYMHEFESDLYHKLHKDT